MTKDDAIRLGYPIYPVHPSQKRRAAWHDYHKRGIYMITLVIEGRYPVFGDLALEPQPHIALSKFGQEVLAHEIAKINRVHHNVEVWHTCIMPDHIHFVWSVNSDFEGKKHLGDVVRGFKYGCTVCFRKLTNTQHNIFEQGYNDSILYGNGQLERMKRYLSDNPRRLALKRQYPDLFQVKRDLMISQTKCQAVGNIFLLDSPEKMEVIVHRADTDADFQEKKREWLACGVRGGVLVSAAISPREREVMNEAYTRGYKTIHLMKDGFPEIYKPKGQAFDACAEGRMLQISPWPYTNRTNAISRQQCLFLNELAIKIAQL